MLRKEHRYRTREQCSGPFEARSHQIAENTDSKPHDLLKNDGEHPRIALAPGERKKDRIRRHMIRVRISRWIGGMERLLPVGDRSGMAAGFKGSADPAEPLIASI